MFLLDTNVFIQAKNFYYDFEIFPSFWEWLDSEQREGHICSIDAVYRELIEGDDALSEWAKDRRDTGWFISNDDEYTQRNIAIISQWTMDSDFKDSAKIEFLRVPDLIIVAKAMASDMTIVTHESLYDPNIKRKIKIPNVCEVFNVPYISTFEMLKRLKARF